MRTGSSGVQMKSSPACCTLFPTNHDRGTFGRSHAALHRASAEKGHEHAHRGDPEIQAGRGWCQDRREILAASTGGGESGGNQDGERGGGDGGRRENRPGVCVWGGGTHSPTLSSKRWIS